MGFRATENDFESVSAGEAYEYQPVCAAGFP